MGVHIASRLLAAAAWAGMLGPLPAGVERTVDIAYGTDAGQVLDVYRPPRPSGPVLVMVHGGAWRWGDKAMRRVVENKANHWMVQGGWMLVSINYRLQQSVTPVQQADDVARALAFVQRSAGFWGADPEQVLLMGHSAGAHLAALVTVAPRFAAAAGATPWRATIVLDGAAFDAVSLMTGPHPALFDKAFGADPAVWREASPARLLPAHASVPPMLLVCSLRRPDDACGQAVDFAQRARAAGVRAEVLPQPLGHAALNDQLGVDGPYTRAVDAFIASLPSLSGSPAAAARSRE